MKKTRVVTIGGGTGHFTILTALKHLATTEFHNLAITAAVGATDSGRSSGRLRVERRILPPGDIIQCLLALSRSGIEQAGLIKFLRRRFKGREGLEQLGGHSVGNMLLTMLAEYTKDFMSGVRAMQEILNVGPDDEVLPVTLENVQLFTCAKDGSRYHCESEIDNRGRAAITAKRRLSPLDSAWLDHDAKAQELAIQRIREAEVIFVGPGDLWSSVIAALLPNGISKAICESKAVKVLVTNVMTKHGETDGYTVQAMAKQVGEYLGADCLDYVIYNNRLPSKKVLETYAQEKAFPVKLGKVFPRPKGEPVYVGANLISSSTLARHDPMKLAYTIENLFADHLS